MHDCVAFGGFFERDLHAGCSLVLSGHEKCGCGRRGGMFGCCSFIYLPIPRNLIACAAVWNLQNPFDMYSIQDIIFTTKPDLLIETGACRADTWGARRVCWVQNFEQIGGWRCFYGCVETGRGRLEKVEKGV